MLSIQLPRKNVPSYLKEVTRFSIAILVARRYPRLREMYDPTLRRSAVETCAAALLDLERGGRGRALDASLITTT